MTTTLTTARPASAAISSTAKSTFPSTTVPQERVSAVLVERSAQHPLRDYPVHKIKTVLRTIASSLFTF